ncbi:M56 family metallopeptidase [Hyphomonas sp.]|uniref:M56 family metallopeptidase n=1 Tax=Hyphomonas sp. TaxID=87 RepID=UPI00391AD597
MSELSMLHALETLGGASLLILLVLAVRRPVARHFGAGLAYALWLLPLARLVMPPLPGGVSVFSWLKGAPDPAPVADTWMPAADAALAAPPAMASAETSWRAEPALPAPDAMLAGAGGMIELAALVGAAVWLTGAIWMAGRSLAAHVQFMAIVKREGRPASGALAALAATVAADMGLRRSPRVVTSLIASGPFVTGLARPTVVLPAWFEAEYSQLEARAALSHEMMHLKRGDLWALQAAELAIAAMWFNPLAHVARTAFRTDQEAACDADVLARGHLSPHAYGTALVKAVRMQTPCRMHMAASLPLTHALKERLKLMAHPAPDARLRRTGVAAAALLGAAALAATASIAAAGEPAAATEIKITDGALWLDGEKVGNRHVVLLSDPAEGIAPVPPRPPGAPGATEIRVRMKSDINELVGAEGLGPIIAAAQDPVIREIAETARELASVHTELGALRRSGQDSARANALEARAKALEAQIEAQAARIEARVNAGTEARVHILERRIETHAANLEAAIEHRVSASIDRERISGRTDMLRGLASECRDSELAGGETRVLTRQTPQGDTVKLACIDSSTGQSRTAALSVLAALPGLTEAERERVQSASEGGSRTFIYRTSRRGEGVPAPEAPAFPVPPQPPEAPAAPEWP